MTQSYTPRNANARSGHKQPVQRENFKLPGNTDKAAEEFMNTMDQLNDLYTEETDALERSKTKHFIGLQDRKIHLGQKYESQIRQMLDRKDDFKALPQKVKDALKQKQKDFTDVSVKNLQAMKRLQDATQRLNTMIMDMAREQASKDGFNYTGRGNIEQSERPISMGFFESA